MKTSAGIRLMMGLFVILTGTLALPLGGNAGEGIGLSNLFSLDLRIHRNAVISAPSLDFGTARPGTTVERSFVLSNAGPLVNDPLVVADILSGDAAYTVRPRSFPIAPMDSVRVDVTLQATSIQGHESVLEIRSNDSGEHIGLWLYAISS